MVKCSFFQILEFGHLLSFKRHIFRKGFSEAFLLGYFGAILGLCWGYSGFIFDSLRSIL